MINKKLPIEERIDELLYDDVIGRTLSLKNPKYIICFCTRTNKNIIWGNDPFVKELSKLILFYLEIKFKFLTTGTIFENQIKDEIISIWEQMQIGILLSYFCERSELNLKIDLEDASNYIEHQLPMEKIEEIYNNFLLTKI